LLTVSSLIQEEETREESRTS